MEFFVSLPQYIIFLRKFIFNWKPTTAKGKKPVGVKIVPIFFSTDTGVTPLVTMLLLRKYVTVQHTTTVLESPS